MAGDKPSGMDAPMREVSAGISDPQWTQRGGTSISIINEKNPLTTTPTDPRESSSPLRQDEEQDHTEQGQGDAYPLVHRQ